VKHSAFAVLMALCGSPELLHGLEGSAVLLTVEYTAQPSYRLRFEVSRLRGRIGDREFAQSSWHSLLTQGFAILMLGSAKSHINCLAYVSPVPCQPAAGTARQPRMWRR
jgi:hypothetical protein